MADGKRPSPFQGLKHLINRIQWRAYAFFHRSRRETYALYEEHAPRKRARGLRPRVVTFGVVLAVLTVLAMIYPLRPTYSEQERRNLTEFPEFSLSALADGSYFDDISTWFADTFPLRDTFLTLQNSVERLYGIQTHTITGEVTQGDEIPEVISSDSTGDEDSSGETALTTDDTQVDEPEETETPDSDTPSEDSEETADPGDAEAISNDETDAATGEDEEELVVPELDDDAEVEKLSAVLTIDNAGYEYYNFVLSYADEYTAAINSAAEQLEGISNVYSIIVPNSMGICVPEDVQEYANTSDQEAAIEYMNSCLSDQVTAIPVYHTLLKHYLEGEYLYFRTDHHWTALGAYRAYEKFAEAAGFTATPLEDYTEHVYEGFLGTFYSDTNSEAMAETPDTVYAYEAPSTNNIHITNSEMTNWLYLVIANVDNSSAANKYGTFIGGDNAYSYIENPNLDDGSAIMLIKESYGNAFAPFLIENYQYVYIIDYRYISQVDSRGIKEMCEDLNIQDVLFLNTISTTRAENLIQKLAAFVG
ncbi:MAG: hypothetical protein LUH48_06820 [Clostridiales bacterium]|nr:hypothetical protein [Clostridiales bacterium]